MKVFILTEQELMDFLLWHRKKTSAISRIGASFDSIDYVQKNPNPLPKPQEISADLFKALRKGKYEIPF